MDIKNMIKRNLEIRNPEWHLLKLAEECNELSLAIIQSITKGNNIEHIYEEMGDVEISIEHIKSLYSKENIYEIIEKSKKKKWKKIDKKVSEIEKQLFNSL